MDAVHYNTTGNEVGTVELSPDVFGVEPNEPVIHQAVVMHLANLRQGNASTKGRSEIHGSNRKPFRQKKTGNARRGDLKTNIQRGGGVYGGPTARSYRQKMPKKQRQLALKSALSLRAQESAVAAIADLAMESGRTRDMASVLQNAGLAECRVVLVTHNASETLLRASRNLPNVCLVPATSLHAFEVMWAERIVFTDSALAQLTGGVG